MRVQATVVGTRIHVRPKGRGYIKGLHRTIPGANWSDTAVAWTLPLSMDSCRALRETFGRDLEILPPLWDWSRGERDREQILGELGRQIIGVQLRRVPDYPVMDKAMSSRPYQSAAAAFIAEGRSVLVADTPGLGKTLEAVAGCVEAATESAGPYLVCAPATSLESVWQREIEMRMPDDAAVWVIEGDLRKRNKLLAEALDTQWDLSTTWVIINIEMLRTRSFWVCPKCKREWLASSKPRGKVVNCGHDPKRVKARHEHKYPQLFNGRWGGIVMDECQRSLIRTSGMPTQTRNGATLLRTRDDGVRIALSGTPMRGKSQRLWGTLNWLRPDIYTAYWSWVERYWYVNNEWHGGRTIGDLRPDRQESLGKALDGIMIRRTKQEVSPELPSKQYMGTPLDPRDPDSPVAVWLPMSPEQDKAYREMERMGSAKVLGGTLNTVGILAELTRLKQFANCYGGFFRTEEEIGSDGIRRDVPKYKPYLPSNKFDWLVQFLMERNIIDPDEEPTGKVVVVSQFTEVLALFAQELSARYDLEYQRDWNAITGKVKGRKRTEAQDRFNDMDSGINLMFLNTKAGGVSITLDAADDMVILDETHDPDDQEQVEDRINNRRPEEKIATRRFWYPKSVGTIEEGIALANLHADKEMKYLLDGRRGLKYLRTIFEEAGHGRTPGRASQH